jgi:hypothetical protein
MSERKGYFQRTRELNTAAATPWRGPWRSYDLIKELVIAIIVVGVISVLLAVLFSSPDDRPTTIKSWATATPQDFLTTATAELAGTSDTATYGPPYNHNGEGQNLAFFRPQKWMGVKHPIDTAKDFVIDPLLSVPLAPAVKLAVARYQAATPQQQARWTDAYTNAVGKSVQRGSLVVLPKGNYGPVAPMMAALLRQAQTGALDGALLSSNQFYQTDYTKPLLFLADGSLLAARAQAQHLLGSQWGMMNETGSYPGQVWLWLYTFWYQIEPFSSSENADVAVWVVMALLTLAFICIPFIPGVRDIPRVIPIHKAIWRNHYRSNK